MGVIYCKKTRRQFLVGSGRSLLALPLLPSLLPRVSLAQSAPAPRRMMLFWFDHNNLNSMWPSPTMATQAVGNSGSREVLLRSLGAIGSHSPALNNPRFNALQTSNLITMIRGFDVEHGAGHGNAAMAAAQGRNSEGNFPTIDTVIAASRSVYPDNTPSAVRKAIRIDLTDDSLFYQKIGNSVQLVPSYHRNGFTRFYNETFSSLTSGTTPPQDFTNELKSNILSRVYASYASFRNGTRISSDDKARLDQHMDYLSDLQRGFAQVQPTNSCHKPNEPSGGTDPTRYVGAYMDLLAIAFKCGLTKFSVMKFEGHDPHWIPNLGNQGRVFHEVMHGSGGADLQRAVKINWWRYHANLIADRFLVHMEEQEGDTGRTYLDNMVTGMLCQGGFANPGGDGGHGGYDSQQILIGSMGGRMRSGRYMTVPRSQNGDTPYVGNNLPYNCFLLTLLQLMGVPQSEYASATPDGQGFGYYGAFNPNHPRRSRFYQPVTELLT